MKTDFLIEQFGDRKICIKGIGKMFYQDGIPISIAIEEFHRKRIFVSLIHIADECLKYGWSAQTTYSRITDDLNENLTDNSRKRLKDFCYATYEEQRAMIFEYLFEND
jgi:4-hydroxy-3-methylbut-2-enyl diphosphate reductase IspH